MIETLGTAFGLGAFGLVAVLLIWARIIEPERRRVHAERESMARTAELLATGAGALLQASQIQADVQRAQNLLWQRMSHVCQPQGAPR